MYNELFKGYGIPVDLKSDDNFLLVKETLSRIGIASKKEKTLWQSCHILHKRGNYSILHFKELFMLDGKSSNIDDTDIARRNTITLLLQDWDLLQIIDDSRINNNVLEMSQIKVLSFKEKPEWDLQAKYQVGTSKLNRNHR